MIQQLGQAFSLRACIICGQLPVEVVLKAWRLVLRDIFLAYNTQKDKTILKNKNHSRSVILGFQMSNQKKGFAIPRHC